MTTLLFSQHDLTNSIGGRTLGSIVNNSGELLNYSQPGQNYTQLHKMSPRYPYHSTSIQSRTVFSGMETEKEALTSSWRTSQSTAMMKISEIFSHAFTFWDCFHSRFGLANSKVAPSSNLLVLLSAVHSWENLASYFTGLRHAITDRWSSREFNWELLDTDLQVHMDSMAYRWSS